jgi:hypothetical protein
MQVRMRDGGCCWQLAVNSMVVTPKDFSGLILNQPLGAQEQGQEWTVELRSTDSRWRLSPHGSFHQMGLGALPRGSRLALAFWGMFFFVMEVEPEVWFGSCASDLERNFSTRSVLLKERINWLQKN